MDKITTIFNMFCNGGGAPANTANAANPMNNGPFGNISNIMQQFNQFKQTFNGNDALAQERVQQMMNSGQINQSQLNAAIQQTNNLYNTIFGR